MPPIFTREIRQTRWIWIVIPGLVGAWLRIHNIDASPAFVDEGANILTALDPRVSAMFEPLEQGRPWLAQLFKPSGWAPAHALEIARLMTASAGIITLTSIGWILNRLRGRLAALCGVTMWALMPLTVFHERMALQDPFVAALLTLSLAFVVTAVTSKIEGRPDWPWFVGAGILFGTAFLLKISALLAWPWLSLIYMATQRRHSGKKFSRRLAWTIFGFVLPCFTLGSDLLRLGTHLGTYDALPALTVDDFLPSAIGRVSTWIGWYGGYGGWPLLLVVFSALLLALAQRDQLALSSALGWFISILTAGLVYHNTYARYILPDHVPLVIFVSLAFSAAFATHGRGCIVAGLAAAIAGTTWLRKDWKIDVSPIESGIPRSEIEQYLTGRWSGNGIDQIISYLQRYTQKHHVACVVFTHRFQRPGCYGLMLEELRNPQIGVIPIGIDTSGLLAMAKQRLRQTTSGRPAAFFLLYEGSLFPVPAWLDQVNAPAHLATTVDRGGGESFSLYQFEP